MFEVLAGMAIGATGMGAYDRYKGSADEDFQDRLQSEVVKHGDFYELSRDILRKVDCAKTEISTLKGGKVSAMRDCQLAKENLYGCVIDHILSANQSSPDGLSGEKAREKILALLPAHQTDRERMRTHLDDEMLWKLHGEIHTKILKSAAKYT